MSVAWRPSLFASSFSVCAVPLALSAVVPVVLPPVSVVPAVSKTDSSLPVGLKLTSAPPAVLEEGVNSTLVSLGPVLESGSVRLVSLIVRFPSWFAWRTKAGDGGSRSGTNCPAGAERIGLRTIAGSVRPRR